MSWRERWRHCVKAEMYEKYCKTLCLVPGFACTGSFVKRGYMVLYGTGGHGSIC